MRSLIFAAALAAAGAAMAGDRVARHGDDSATLTEQPCPIVDTVAKVVPEGLRGYLRLARVTFQRQDFTACWMETGDLAVLFYEDGDTGTIPMGDFKDVLDI